MKLAQIEYTNYRNERNERVIDPVQLLWVEPNEYHKVAGWCIQAWDRTASPAKLRDFEIRNIHSWRAL